jgi:predicted O-methyltransferase YrrM
MRVLSRRLSQRGVRGNLTGLNESGRLRVRDIEIVLMEGLDNPPPSNDHQIILYKDRRFLQTLVNICDKLEPKRIIEIGIFHGGSTIFWAERYRPEKLVAFDIGPDAPYLTNYLQRHSFGTRVRPYFQVAQDDSATLRRIVGEEFGTTPVDLVIDDASHHLAETRAAIEALLPFVRPRGLYVIEDWAWGHHRLWPPEAWADQPLMSPLISELMLVCGNGAGVIDRLEIHPNFVAVWRGPQKLPEDGSFRLAGHYTARNFSATFVD